MKTKTIYTIVDKDNNIIKNGDELLIFEKKIEATYFKRDNDLIVPRGSKIKKAFILLEEDTKVELKNCVTKDTLNSLGII